MLENKKTLHLTLKKKWFDMIASGEKKEEYREIKDFWTTRLKWKTQAVEPFDIIEFRNGYSKNAPKIIAKCLGIEIGKPKLKWCADAIDFDKDNGDYEDCYIIKLGDVIKKG